MALPSTQTSIAIAAPRQPLVAVSSPVHPPPPGHVVMRVLWAASTPLDLHRADGGLLVPSYPYLAGGGGAAGTLAAVSSSGDTKGLAVGDRATSFAFRGGAEANHQEYMTVPAYLVSKVPDGIPLQAAVTVPVNLVTVFHAAVRDLGLALPWPRPADDGEMPQRHRSILIWGASSSVGVFAVQVLRHWGYTRILAVASARHHDYLAGLGATACFDYTRPFAVDDVRRHIKERDGEGATVPYILDCIGSLQGTLAPLTQIATRGSVVAVMLPVIVRDASVAEAPEYEMDASRCLPGQWADGVEVRGVRTHFYLDDPEFREKMQPEMVPQLLAQGVVQPNRQRVVEGATMLERAQKALDLLRDKAVSGERLVWRVSEE
ncbi:hypothetical protein LMH87_011537 [Akanthomyces muscarius]|uniref:Enoyl reductase (ER) domain-containing protein n=1 Tax=Akanthomyces muscarius TaxID=2231603 RepID=A0A9W8QBY8_AKAMU|nr:hypothetical protein LMH87_011537 [Akanthomyces muscarius]KAJ4150803.1 hypothetical protein LMH87_011537 [Akanthomyces muscarius]